MMAVLIGTIRMLLLMVKEIRVMEMNETERAEAKAMFI
jgi:hypothetical protein